MRFCNFVVATAALVWLGSANAQSEQNKGGGNDPFADVGVTAPAPERSQTRSWTQKWVTENLGFRREIMSQFATSERGQPASRQSAGFEVLKKWSTATSTVAAFNMQGRLVRRDGYQPVLNEMEGMDRPGWEFEYHNLYLDLYNVLNPLLTAEQRGTNVGRINFRVGRFYVPFGLNLQTDTHGTVLQLSNDRSLGFERDWYAGFWGSVNQHVNYDAYYLAGSGYDVRFKGQKGLAALRLSLGNRYNSEYGLEGGVSMMGGERLSHDGQSRIETRRAGIDGRYKRAVPSGLLTLTSEFSGGRDADATVVMQLYQTEYLHASRRWGLASQYRRYTRQRTEADSSLIGEISWYFRNDVGNSNLHWIKLNVERKLERMQSAPAWLVTLQYYFYR